MSSVLSGLLGEVRKGAIDPTLASIASSQKRATVSATSRKSPFRSHAPHSSSTTTRTATVISRSLRPERPSPRWAPGGDRPDSMTSRRSLESKRLPDVCGKNIARPQQPFTPTFHTAIIKKRGRLSEAAYKNMSVDDLRLKARRRRIQLMDDSKHYLITVLMVFDEEYDQLYTRIGNPWECESYARAAVEHHNEQVMAEEAERCRARAKPDGEKKRGRPNQVQRSAEKPQVVNRMVNPATTVRKTVEKSIEVEGPTRPRQQPPISLMADRKSRPSTDSGYSTGSSTMPKPITKAAPCQISPSKAEAFKGKKRALPDHMEGTSMRAKKPKLFTTEQDIPRVVKKSRQRQVPSRNEESSKSTKASEGPSRVAPPQRPNITGRDVKQAPPKKVLKGNAKENRPSQAEEALPRGVAQRVSRRVRISKSAEPAKNLGKRQAYVEESESDSSSESEDDWLVEDVQDRPRKKVNRGVNKFFAGMK
ncbi:hypothetical protein J1614_006162 [Plenodomus biglobosus]|nr:hypothetical protein J1614_006162 [Plenodomus biglobosus]